MQLLLQLSPRRFSKKHLLILAPVAIFIALALFIAASVQTAGAQTTGASYAEGFEDVGAVNDGDDGPANLIADGWIFSNQSEPTGSKGWFGLESDAHTGTGTLAANFDSTVCGEQAAISNWAVLPAIPDQAEGDPMTFYVQGGSGGRVDRLQVRYAPGGGTDTGSGAQDVGDFTELLLDWQSEPFSVRSWENQTISLPGAGRIAFRYFLPEADACTSAAYLLQIDTLTVGDPPQGDVPFPQPGETVVWDTSISPVVIEGRQVIQSGGTVLVEPGVEIQAEPDSTLVVQGTLRGEGTAASPILFTAPSVFPPLLEVEGTADLNAADVSGQVRSVGANNLTFYNTTFHGNGLIRGSADFVELEGSHFQGPTLHLRITASAVLLRDTTFDNASASMSGYVYLDGVQLDGETLSLSKPYQPGYVDNVTVTNASGAALSVAGIGQGNQFFLGPDVTLQNSQYPVSLTSAGLLTGSNVPATGNAENVVRHSAEPAQLGPVEWEDVGVPYLIDGASLLGEWNLRPGVTVQFEPGGGINDVDGSLNARGLPGDPVTFERRDPAQAWNTLLRPDRLEYVVIDGADVGARYSGTGFPRFVDNAILRNNNTGLVGNVIVRGTQFLDNGTGAVAGFPTDLNGETNPNSFVGNTLAVETADDATHNWWGHRSGPSGPQNKNGQGDPVASGVPVKPYLKSEPDFGDTPPVVNINDPYLVTDPGQQVMLTWSAQDDVAVQSQRILLSRTGDAPGDFQQIAGNLPGDQNAFAWTVPDTSGVAHIRIESEDANGQVGWDQITLLVTGDNPGTLTLTSDLTGPFQAGDHRDICWHFTGGGGFTSGITAFLMLDNGRDIVNLGGAPSSEGDGCLSLGLNVPALSTDNARVALKLSGSEGQEWVFSEPFAIRLDPRLPVAPPTISLDAPGGPVDLSPGSTLPIAWTASDDVALRSFSVQASYDGGRTWHVIADDLPPTARSFDWQVAPDSGFQNVHLRVVAVDRRFHTASATTLSESAQPTPTSTPTATATPLDPTPTATATTAPPTPTPTATSQPPTPTPTATATATTAPPTPTPTATDEPADVVEITRAEYDAGKGELRVEATSSDATAQLDVYDTGSGEHIGTLENEGDGEYRGEFSWPVNPENVTVESSLGGSDSAGVQLK